MKKLPLLDEKSSHSFYPHGRNAGKCPVCGASFKKVGFAFLSGGGVLSDKNGNTLIKKNGPYVRGYLHIGFHGSENVPLALRSGYDEAYMTSDVVSHLPSGEFELCFCSIRCLRNWFNMALDGFVMDFRKEYGYDP